MTRGPKHYILNEDNTTKEVDWLTWAIWFEAPTNRIVAWTQINSDVAVSTIFLGLDHQFGEGPPLLFETMVFEKTPRQDDSVLADQWRYSTYDDAETNHRAIVRRLRAKQKAGTS